MSQPVGPLVAGISARKRSLAEGVVASGAAAPENEPGTRQFDAKRTFASSANSVAAAMAILLARTAEVEACCGGKEEQSNHLQGYLPTRTEQRS
jgi:hypothetical protein